MNLNQMDTTSVSALRLKKQADLSMEDSWVLSPTARNVARALLNTTTWKVSMFVEGTSLEARVDSVDQSNQQSKERLDGRKCCM